MSPHLRAKARIGEARIAKARIGEARIAKALIVATAVLGSGFLSDPLLADEEDPAPLLKIPIAAIQEGDERSLPMIQEAALAQAIRMELAALDMETEWLTTRTDPTRAQRVTADRQLMDALGQRAHLSAIHTASRHDLPLADRYLLAFVHDKLRTAAVPMALIETWTERNHRYLDSGDLASRDSAIADRGRLLGAMEINARLRQVAGTITRQGPLAPEVRHQLVQTLRSAFPDAPLPVQEVAPALPPDVTATLAALSGDTPGASAGPLATGGPAIPAPLPRLDGVEVPMKEIPDLRAALEALRQLGQ